MYLAYEDADDPEAVRRYLRMAEEQMATLNQIASQTLGFARASVGLKSTNIVALAEAAFRIHQTTIDTRKIYLVKQLPKELAAEVHVGEILQVLSNLLANALDALADGGSLSFRLSKRNREIHFVIADNGSGIPPLHLNQIFEPFFTTKEDQGTGLGLALSKRLIERPHGRIRVRSTMRPGRTGSAFRVSLPI